MRPYAEPIATFRVLLRGYEQALARFREAAGGHDPTAAFVALLEVLNWAVALEDRCAEHWAPEGKPLGREWPSRLANAEPVHAVRFARNRVHHQWAEALELDTSGFRSPLRAPLRSFEWVWRGLDGLPSTPPDRRDPRGEKRYTQLLAGRPAESTLMVLHETYHQIADLLEPVLAPNRALAQAS